MSLNKLYRTSSNLEKEGVVINFPSDDNPLAWMRCRRPGGRNVKFQKAMNARLREYRKDLQDNEGSESKEFQKVLALVYADAVIVDWGGNIEGPDGKFLELNHDNVVWLLTEDCPDLFLDLQRRLEVRLRWQEENRKAAGKNSQTASATNSGGGRQKKN